MITAAVAGAMVVAVLLATLGAAAVPAPAFTLRRTAPMRSLERLQRLDRVRLAIAKRNGVGEFPLLGLPLPGIYYINMKLGSPSKEYAVQFDTGSDLMWVSCSSCTSCPETNNLGIPFEFYNPNNSSTSANISCSDYRCKDAIKEGYSVCQTSDSPNNQCGYSMTYADTATSGYYVSDTMYFDTVIAKSNDQAASSSASVLFGCSNSRSEDLQGDGVVGFGKNAPSIILQLNSQGVSSKAFSHCLTSSEDGGSILLLGEVVAPGFAFTPLILSQPRYNLNMTHIDVNGHKVLINSSFFTTSNTQGTFVDSGTSLAYLADGVYDPLIRAIDDAVPRSIHSFLFNGTICYRSSSSNISLFPRVTMYFEGGAPMTVGPKNYLLLKGYYDNLEKEVLCIGFLRSKDLESYEHITILGDLVLHDKIVVYDLEKMRLGWVNYNCSLLSKTPNIVLSGSLRPHVPSYSSGLIAIGVALFNTVIVASRQLDNYWGWRRK